MITTDKPFVSLTAEDLMSAPVEMIPQEMSLRAAAHMLSQAQISGAPVVNAEGRCVGMLSATDFLHRADKGDALKTSTAWLPRTCRFQAKHKVANGTDEVLCNMPPDACSLQVKHKEPDGGTTIFCNQPHSVPCDWQVVEGEDLPTEEVRRHMTTDLVTVAPNTPITDLARLMLDAHIHHLIVVGERGRPVGMVTSTDLLAAVAYMEEHVG